MDYRKSALDQLLEKADKQGYIVIDDIMDSADSYSLSIQDVDWLSDTIASRGIIIYDDPPSDFSKEEDDYEDHAQLDYDCIFDKVVELSPGQATFIDYVRQIKPPQLHEVSNLQYLVREGNEHARQRMFEMHLRLAVKLALQRSEAYDTDIDELIQEACVGLMTAVDKYDPDYNGAFGSYATLYVLQNISRTQPLINTLTHFPAQRRDDFFSAYPELKQKGCIGCADLDACEFAINCISNAAQCSYDQACDMISMFMPYLSVDAAYSSYVRAASYREKYNNVGCLIRNETAFVDPLGSELIWERITQSLMAEQIRNTLNTLTQRERRIICLRYGLIDGHEYSLLEVGKIFDRTRERIRQIEAKALRKLRHPSRSKKLKDYLD